MIDLDGLVCPYCNGYAMFDSITALEISHRKIASLKREYDDNLKGANKQSILKYIFMKRENLCGKYVTEYHTNIISILAANLFLQRIMKTLNQDEVDIKKTIDVKTLDQYEYIINEERDHILLKSCLAKMLYEKKYEQEHITERELIENFHIFPTEEYVKWAESYKKYDILSENNMEEEMGGNRIGIEYEKKRHIVPHPYTDKEFITKAYEGIYSFYIGLLQDSLCQDAFNLESYKKIMSRPSQIREFVFTFKGKPECSVTEFLCNARKIFKKDDKLLRKVLLFEESNADIFPCFIKISEGDNERVLIPYGLTVIMYVFLHAVITKKSLGDETHNRSKKFEERVERIFKEHGFQYYYYNKPKKMEIDGIAVKGNHCFVIEAKSKKPRTLGLEANVRASEIRDMKGIVDGKKFTTKDNQTIEKIIPSLIKKLEFVKQNCKNFGIQDTHKMKFCGIIVAMYYPWISEYKNVRIMTDEELKECLSEERSSMMTCDA